MRICIIHPKACTESAQELAKAIGADCITPREYQDVSLRYDKVFNYGCGWVAKRKNLINQPDAINNCIDKRKTFKLLEKHNIPIPEYTTRPQDVKPNWGV